MSDTDTPAILWEQEPYKTFIAAAESLQEQGLSSDTLIDTLLSLALSMAKTLHGPRIVARRLAVLALHFADNTEQIDAANAESAEGMDTRQY
jgi:hypothetical protein